VVARPTAAGGEAGRAQFEASSPLDGWRLRSRDQLSPERQRRRPLAEAAILAVLLVWNLAANSTPDEAALPLGLAGAGLLVLIARRSGLSWAYLGLGTNTMRPGIRTGMMATGMVAAALLAIAAIPATREVLADDRFVGIGTLEMLYETLVRIPLGTALAEEVAFRGVLLGMLLLWVTPRAAVVVSSILFGLWHVLPAVDAIESNPAADIVSGGVGSVLEVAAQVVATGLAGIVFAQLRARSGSILAPALTHWALNGTAYAAGWLVIRNGWT
jgi:membrane protease YdiL (CAAX protease family)